MIVIVDGVEPDNLIIMAALANVWAGWVGKPGTPPRLRVTSGSEGRHMAGSRHGTGQALDVGSRGFRADLRLVFLEAVVARLGSLKAPPVAVSTSKGPGFQAGTWLGIYEAKAAAGPHFHLERD